MRGNKILQTMIMIVVLIIFEGFFLLTAPSLWGADTAYMLWGRANMGLFICGVIISLYMNKKHKK